MRKIDVYHYDAFSDRPNMGNPAGIIFDADRFTADEMQAIAKGVNFTECAFLCSSDRADMRLRFFMPRQETPLCGHATIAAVCALMERDGVTEDCSLTVETQAGILRVDYFAASREVQMAQADAQFKPFIGSTAALMAAIGLKESDLDPRYPIQFGSTGVWTLIVPIKSLASFSKMTPKSKRFPEVMPEMPNASVHPITLETRSPSCQMHGRHFSSAFAGTVEDSVTGTASGVMCAYHLCWIDPRPETELYIEQGHEMGKDGVVHAWASINGDAVSVRIAGTAVLVQKLEAAL